MKEILKRIESEGSKREPTISDLKAEINETKRELNELKTRVQILELVKKLPGQPSNKEDDEQEFQISDKNQSTSLITQEEKSINSMDQIINQKWYARITLVIAKEFIITIEALIDSGADLNCVSEGIIPTKFFTKTT